MEEFRRHTAKLWGKTILIGDYIKAGKIQEVIDMLADWWYEYEKLKDSRYPSEMYRLSKEQFVVGIEGIAIPNGYEGISQEVLKKVDKLRTEEIKEEDSLKF